MNDKEEFRKEVKEYVEANLEALLKQYFVKYHMNPESLKKGGKRCFLCDRPLKGFAKTLDNRLIKELWDIRLWCSAHSTRQFNPRIMWKTHEDRANLIADFQKLKHWGFILKSKTSGWWLFTDRGLDFLNKKIRVPRVRYVFNNQVIPELDSEYDLVEVETVDPRWQSDKVDYASNYIFIKPPKVKKGREPVDVLNEMFPKV